MKRIIILLTLSSFMLQASFSRDSNGIVTDTKTGLQWQDNYSDNADQVKSTDFNGSIEYCKNLSISEVSGWRVPNYNELLSLVDFSQTAISLNPIFIYTNKPATESYITSTTYKSNLKDLNKGSAIWVVTFGTTNYVNILYPYHLLKTDNSLVRCVRDKN